MIDKLREILARYRIDFEASFQTSRDIYVKNESFRSVLEQVSISAHELASGAGQISEEVSGVSITSKDIEVKIDELCRIRQRNERSLGSDDDPC